MDQGAQRCSDPRTMCIGTHGVRQFVHQGGWCLLHLGERDDAGGIDEVRMQGRAVATDQSNGSPVSLPPRTTGDGIGEVHRFGERDGRLGERALERPVLGVIGALTVVVTHRGSLRHENQPPVRYALGRPGVPLRHP